MSTFIIKNDKLEGNFYVTDNPHNMEQVYEAGKIIIMDRPALHFFEANEYRPFIDNQVTPAESSEDNHIKKTKATDLLFPIHPNHVLHNFTQNPERLQTIIKETYRWLIHVVKPNLFPNYHTVSENWTWRLTVTEKDAMHLDSYIGQDNDLHNLRMFINLDNRPRVWRVSYSLPQLYKKYKHLLTKELRKKHPNEINDVLNKQVPWHELPFHEIHFAPYSIWFCNSQIVSHQGYFGRKMAAFTFRIDPKSMNNPELAFDKIASRVISEL